MKANFYLLILLSLSLFFSSCYGINRLESGRTSGHGNSELTITAALTKVPDDFQNSNVTRFLDLDIVSVDAGIKYGITETADIGFRTGFSGTFVDLKMQLAGTQTSPFAMSSGLSFGIHSSDSWSFELPFFTSYAVNDKFELLCAPRFFFYDFIDRETPSNSAFGLSGGFLYGERAKIGLELANFNLVRTDADRSGLLWTGSLGVKIPIGKKPFKFN